MEDIILLLKSIAILSLIAICLFYGLKLLQKYTKLGSISSINNEDNVKISSISYIDHVNKIVTLKSKNKTYILLLGNKNDILIDQYENTNDNKK